MFKEYDIFLSGLMARPTRYVLVPEETCASLPLQIDAKCITLAQYDRVSKAVITAHNISEYRRRQFNLMLLPNIELMLDAFTEGKVFTR